MNGDAGTDVLAQHADVGRQAAAGDLFAGQNLYQLLFATRGVLGRKHLDQESSVAHGGADGFDRLRFVVLDADQHLLRLDQVNKYLDPRDKLVCLLAHQPIVGRDIGLTFGAVDDQCTNFPGGRPVQLDGRWEAGATESAYACLTDLFQQLVRLRCSVIRLRLQFDPFVLAIAVDHDRSAEHP